MERHSTDECINKILEMVRQPFNPPEVPVNRPANVPDLKNLLQRARQPRASQMLRFNAMKPERGMDISMRKEM